jgi:hypothetical protein
VDGPLLPRLPYELGYASFAQPSGLTSDGQWLYVADSEGSSIRAVPFDPSGAVRTVVGTSQLPQSRLFTFGDRDGERQAVLLQHPLGVAYHDGVIYVADTYNNKIKAVQAATGVTRTIAGTGQPGSSDVEGTFDEPGGIAVARGKLFVADTNNHLIRTVELSSGKVAALQIEGLTPPQVAPQTADRPSFPGAVKRRLDEAVVKPAGGQIRFSVRLGLPSGWKINPLAPLKVLVQSSLENGLIAAEALGWKSIEPPKSEFEVALPVSGQGKDEVTLSMTYYYCQEGGEGLCRVGSIVWTVPLTVSKAGRDASIVTLVHDIRP